MASRSSVGNSWSTIQIYHQECVLEVEYIHYPGVDWGGYAWRVPPQIELREVRIKEGPADTVINEDSLKEAIYDERHR